MHNQNIIDTELLYRITGSCINYTSAGKSITMKQLKSHLCQDFQCAGQSVVKLICGFLVTSASITVRALAILSLLQQCYGLYKTRT